MKIAHKPKSLLTKLADSVMRVDKYGETANFSIEGKSTYPSLCGTLVSLAILVVVIPYAINKFVIMKEFNDTNY